jgi:hypothetical protein
MHENAARLLYVDHLGPALARRVDPARAPWVWIVGFGDTGEAVARRLLGSPCAPDPQPIRLTVVDRHATDRVDSFLLRHPAVLEHDLGRLEPVDAEIVGGADLVERIGRGALPDAVVVCLWDEWMSLTLGLAVSRRFLGVGPRVFVRTPASGLHETLAALDDAGARLRTFGTIPECCGVEGVLGEGLDRLAIAVHEVYRARAASTGGKAVPPWSGLTEDKRDANRAQVDQIPVVLAATGFRAVAGERKQHPVPSPFEESRRKDLARAEHARWCAERWMAGWRLGDDEARNENPHLVPWDQVPEKVQAFDYTVVDQLAETLNLLGIRVVRE